ncbi:MAG TPA: MFS transporter [Chloroflexota bacterium]|nr:MFS transporter [Chloroflexota bacterium]
MRVPSMGAVFGLGGLPAAIQRGLVVAFATSVASIMGVQLVFPVLPPMMEQLAVSKSTIGLVVTVYTVPMIFLAPVAGAIADLHGRRPLLFGGLVLFGLAGAGVGLAPSFEWVLALRALQGVGASAVMPLTIVLLSDLLHGEHETSAQGLKVVLDRVSLTIVPLVAGILATLTWRLPYFLFALALPVAFLGLAWLPETRTAEHANLRAYVGSFGAIGRRPRLLLAFSAGFLRFFLDYGYFTYLPIYLALARGSSPAEVGLLFGAFAIGAMVTASQVGRLSRGRDVVDLVFVGFVLAGVSVLVIPLLPAAIFVAGSLFVYGLGNGLISPLQKNLLTRNAPPETRGGVVSLDRVFQQVAKSLAPGLMGALLVVADVSAVFWVLGALSLASVGLAAGLLGTHRPAHRAAISASE